MSRERHFIQSVMNVKTGGVQIVKDGKLADGYHVINDVEYLVFTVIADLPQVFERIINRERE